MYHYIGSLAGCGRSQVAGPPQVERKGHLDQLSGVSSGSAESIWAFSLSGPWASSAQVVAGSVHVQSHAPTSKFPRYEPLQLQSKHEAAQAGGVDLQPRNVGEHPVGFSDIE